MKLTDPQLTFLFDLADFCGTTGMYVHENYKPALKLVDLGLAYWRRENMIEITPAGIAERDAILARSRALRALSPQKESGN